MAHVKSRHSCWDMFKMLEILNGLKSGEDGSQNHPYPNCSGKWLDNTLSSKCSSSTSSTAFLVCVWPKPILLKRSFSKTDTHSLEKWETFITEDMEINNWPSITTCWQSTPHCHLCLYYVMQVITGPHVCVLLVHVTVQKKMGLITKPYDLGYCWIVLQKMRWCYSISL